LKRTRSGHILGHTLGVSGVLVVALTGWCVMQSHAQQLRRAELFYWQGKCQVLAYVRQTPEERGKSPQPYPRIIATSKCHEYVLVDWNRQVIIPK